MLSFKDAWESCRSAFGITRRGLHCARNCPTVITLGSLKPRSCTHSRLFHFGACCGCGLCHVFIFATNKSLVWALPFGHSRWLAVDEGGPLSMAFPALFSPHLEADIGCTCPWWFVGSLRGLFGLCWTARW